MAGLYMSIPPGCAWLLENAHNTCCCVMAIIIIKMFLN